MKRRSEQAAELTLPRATALPSVGALAGASSGPTSSTCPATAALAGAALLQRSGRLLRSLSGSRSRDGSGDFAAAAAGLTPVTDLGQEQPFQQQQQQPSAAHDGQPRRASPPPGTAGSGRRASRLLLALALAARADYACPHSLVADDEAMRERLSACLGAMARAEGGAASPFSPAARALMLYGVAATAPPTRPLVAVQAAYSALCLLDDPAAAAAAARQLARLQAAPEPGHAAAQAHAYALTLPQLQHVCLWRVAEAGAQLLAMHRSPGLLLHTGSARLPADTVHEVQVAVAAAVAVLPRLEAGSPKGLLAAGAAAAALHRPERAARLRLRALRAAQQQHSSYWELRAAAALFAGPASVHLHGDAGDLHMGGAAMQAAVLVLQTAAPTLQLCEQALPAPWALRLGAEVAGGRRRAAAVQTQLDLVRQIARDGIGGRHFQFEMHAAAAGGHPAQQQQQQGSPDAAEQRDQPGGACADGGRGRLVTLVKLARPWGSGTPRPGEQGGSEGSCATGGMGQGSLPASGTALLSRFSG